MKSRLTSLSHRKKVNALVFNTLLLWDFSVFGDTGSYSWYQRVNSWWSAIGERLWPGFDRLCELVCRLTMKEVTLVGCWAEQMSWVVVSTLPLCSIIEETPLTALYLIVNKHISYHCFTVKVPFLLNYESFYCEAAKPQRCFEWKEFFSSSNSKRLLKPLRAKKKKMKRHNKADIWKYKQERR